MRGRWPRPPGSGGLALESLDWRLWAGTARNGLGPPEGADDDGPPAGAHPRPHGPVRQVAPAGPAADRRPRGGARASRSRARRSRCCTGPRGQIAEQFRTLRNSIVALNPEGAPRTIVMTSALRGEGKTVATLNLAVAMAEMPGAQVLVIDANLHQPAIEEYFDLPRRQGLTRAAARGRLPLDQAIRATYVPEGLGRSGRGHAAAQPVRALGLGPHARRCCRHAQAALHVRADRHARGHEHQRREPARRDRRRHHARRALGATPRHYVEQVHNQLETLGGNVLGTCLTGANLVDTASGKG